MVDLESFWTSLGGLLEVDSGGGDGDGEVDSGGGDGDGDADADADSWSSLGGLLEVVLEASWRSRGGYL